MGFEQFDLVYHLNKSPIHVVLMGPLEIPYFEDGIAADFAFTPLDPTNPEEWAQTFTAYITFNLLTVSYEILAEHSLKRCEEEPLFNQGHIPFDQGTSQLRVVLGLIRLAERWWGGKHSGYLDSHLCKKDEKE